MVNAILSAGAVAAVTELYTRFVSPNLLDHIPVQPDD